MVCRPNKDQYIEVIKNGDDTRNKRVILHMDGTFELSYANDDPSRDPSSYVGRSETLDAGNDYVGVSASQDNTYINKSYAMFLKAWINYKKFKATGKYLEFYPPESVDELERIIDTL